MELPSGSGDDVWPLVEGDAVALRPRWCGMEGGRWGLRRVDSGGAPGDGAVAGQEGMNSGGALRHGRLSAWFQRATKAEVVDQEVVQQGGKWGCWSILAELGT